jgi:predicted RNA binding protein with dsRBD fold (UPF0201 family)
MSDTSSQLVTRKPPWSDRLAFDIALRLEGSCESLEDIAAKYRITPEDIKAYAKDKLFERRVDEYRKDIEDKGLTFRLKARSQAEELLKTSWAMIHSPEISPAVRADLIKQTVKWGGLEVAADSEGPTGGVSITINLGDSKSEVAGDDARVIHVPNTPPPVIDAD